MTYKSPAEGIKDLLVAANIGTFPPPSASPGGWGIAIGEIVAKPDQLIAINETGGKPSEPKMSIDYPSVQVRVRAGSNGYLAARAKAKDVKDALLGLPSQNLNGDRWIAINMIGDIANVGVDTNDRPQFVVNFSIILEPAAAGYRV